MVLQACLEEVHRLSTGLRRQLPRLSDILNCLERHDEGVGTGAHHRNIIKKSSVYVARRFETTHERVLGGGESAVGALRPSQTKFNTLDVSTRSEIHSGSICTNQRSVID